MKAQFLLLCIVFHFFRSYLSTDKRFWPKYSSRTGWNFWKKCLNCVPPSVCKPLTFIFEKYRVWKFSWCLKCLLIKNWPVSIGIFDFTDTRNIILAYESVLCDGEFSVYQLTSIFQELYNAYDKNPSLELTEVFLDISKALERVWHKAILDKIKCMDIDGNFSKLVESFLSGLTLMK